jgi:hypothetical protein
MRDSYQNDVWGTFFAAQRRKMIRGMVRLNDLMFNREVGADEDENVLVYLCHVQHSVRNRNCCQEKRGPPSRSPLC